MKRTAVFIVALLSVVLIAATACGGDEDTPTPRPRATSVPAATVAPTATTAPPATTPPAAAATPTATTAPAAAEVVSLEISVKGDALSFNKDQFEVPAGAQVLLTFDNVSSINQHNWVIVEAGSKDDVAGRGSTAGPAKDWVQPGDTAVIAHTKLLDPAEIGDVSFAAPPPGTYQFVCTFPGHNFTMFGDFEVTG